MSEARMKATEAIKLEAPRIQDGKALLIAGFEEHYQPREMHRLPAQWQRFAPHIGTIPGQVGGTTYGVVSNLPDSVKYLTGVEISGSSGLPQEFTVAHLPAQRYLIFRHREHVSRLRETMDAIAAWLPGSGYQAPERAAESADFFERYSEEFNPQTGIGGMEVWIPIRM